MAEDNENYRFIRDANNHLKGTEYEVEQSGPDSPVRRGIITIDGVMMRLLVYPPKLSKQGRVYNSVRLQYLPDCGYVLKAVKVGKQGVM